MDTEPEPRPDLTAAQRIAIALGTADLPPEADGSDVDPEEGPRAPVFPGPPA